MTTGLDELSDEALAILEASRTADDPSVEDRARIDATFALKLNAYGIAAPLAQAPVTTAHTTTASTATAVKGGTAALAAKLILSAVVGLGLVAAGLSYAPSYAPHGAPAPKRPAALVAKPIASTHATTTHDESLAASAAAPNDTSPALGSEVSLSLGDAADTAASIHTHGAAPAHRDSTAASSTAARRVSNDSLRAEVALLQSATEELRLEHYGRAMRLLEAHAARFADGALREERRGLHVLALCAVGQKQLGLLERERFLREAPGSVLADRVRSACESVKTGNSKVLRP